MRIIYPLIVAVGLPVDTRDSLYPVDLFDAASLHITAFAMEVFVTRVIRRQENSTSNTAAMLHFQKGLSLVRERLLKNDGDADDERSKISDSMIGAVLKLTSAAHFEGNWDVAMQHLHGVWRMVNLRGGLHVFGNSRLLMEMLR